jgi:DMSO/TMAO reductase YedYZ heme-binding membrane subunit
MKKLNILFDLFISLGIICAFYTAIHFGTIVINEYQNNSGNLLMTTIFSFGLSMIGIIIFVGGFLLFNPFNLNKKLIKEDK